MLRRFLAMMCLVLMISYSVGVGSAFAYDGEVTDYTKEAGTQIGRGLLNILSSPAEIPCTIRDEVGEYGDGVWTGIGQGTMRFFKRAVVGVSEVLTFIMPRGPAMKSVCVKRTAPKVHSYR